VVLLKIYTEDVCRNSYTNMYTHLNIAVTVTFDSNTCVCG